MNNAFLLIPKISGFPRFNEATPAAHGKLLLAELMAAVVSSNALGMGVSHTEGEDLLFYREGDAPSLFELIEQVRAMFSEFHTQTNKLEAMRICPCKACKMVGNLTLQFVAHSGEVGFIRAVGASKPHGKVLLAARQLLKADLVGAESLLVTAGFSNGQTQQADLPPSVKLGPKQIVATSEGDISCDCFLLGEIRHAIPPTPLPPLPQPDPNPILIEELVQGKLHDVFDLVSNLSLRTDWNPALRVVQFDKSKVNRIGNAFVCRIGNAEVTGVTSRAAGVNGEAIFGEQLSGLPVVGEMSFLYGVSKVEEGVLVRLEAHFPKVPFFKKMALRLLRQKYRQQLADSAGRIKAIFV